jgi:hypothetical protein
MTDDIISKLKADALEAARAVPIPKNPRAYELADKIWALSDDYLSGRKRPDPVSHALANRIRAIADRILRQR